MWRELAPGVVLTAGQKDAFVTASWLTAAGDSGELREMLQPALNFLEVLSCSRSVCGLCKPPPVASSHAAG